MLPARQTQRRKEERMEVYSANFNLRTRLGMSGRSVLGFAALAVVPCSRRGLRAPATAMRPRRRQ
jgi:hypothetical protein